MTAIKENWTDEILVDFFIPDYGGHGIVNFEV